MNFKEIKKLDDAYHAETFSRYPIAFERGQGATLVDTEGREYIDFGAGIAVNIFGVNGRGQNAPFSAIRARKPTSAHSKRRGNIPSTNMARDGIKS